MAETLEHFKLASLNIELHEVKLGIANLAECGERCNGFDLFHPNRIQVIGIRVCANKGRIRIE